MDQTALAEAKTRAERVGVILRFVNGIFVFVLVFSLNIYPIIFIQCLY